MYPFHVSTPSSAVSLSRLSSIAPVAPCRMQHVAALDAYDFDDASAATQEIVDECKRRSCHSRAKRQQRGSSTAISHHSTDAGAATDALRFADVRTQDPAVLAHLLADHFVAKGASNAALAAPSAPAKPQHRARPVAGAVSLGSFRSWQFGERCLATYRVLFGRPLCSAATPTVVPPCSPRPRKRKHVTPPTSSSSESSEGDQLDMMELETTGEMLALPTVDELLELPTDDVFVVDGKADVSATPLEADDVFTGLALDLDAGLGSDATVGGDPIDLLWDLDADGGVEELRFLAPSPSSFSPVSEAMQDI
ncbi:hypothetical protein PF008_g3399 [Phytophthora fragariae]|uniref:Uncharacterized protein n=1 Tax=Phytophthora fragariae TaxID=53985 RepID=A0A6G0SEL8_9STRA|nr:hypothetical protein PF008_g3399 [Phytophthora fragariae]